MVGHSEYSLMPSTIFRQHTCSLLVHTQKTLLPCLRASSSSTLNAVNFAGSTPCRPRIWMLALEKPHWGVSGVPFMNSTTGADATALSIACRVSADRNLRAMGEMMRGENLAASDDGAGRAACRNACAGPGLASRPGAHFGSVVCSPTIPAVCRTSCVVRRAR